MAFGRTRRKKDFGKTKENSVLSLSSLFSPEEGFCKMNLNNDY